MKLSLFTDIGLRTLMRLAANSERPFSTGELADELDLSRNHLTKVVARLSKAGFIRSRRGNQGGISLARPAEQIRIGDVVAELEAETSLVECFRPDGGNCILARDCGLAICLANARKHFIEELNRTALSDISHGAVSSAAE